jgi:hypothetical protein
MRLISFSHTTDQIRRRTKTVTRRTGWAWLQPGTLLCAVVKSRGLRPGERIKRLAALRVKKVEREPLRRILRHGRPECRREGFPDLAAREFVEMFCRTHRGCQPSSIITRIEFEYL